MKGGLGRLQRRALSLIHADHECGRPGVPLPELRQRAGVVGSGWSTLAGLIRRGVIGIDEDSRAYLRELRPALPGVLPANVHRITDARRRSPVTPTQATTQRAPVRPSRPGPEAA